MPYDIREIDNKYCVYKLEPDERLKCYDDVEEAAAYLAVLERVTEDENKARIGVDKYSTEEEALVRADEIGCEGVHTMTEGGDVIYMPCSTHSEYIDQVGLEEGENMDEYKRLELKSIDDDHFVVGGWGVVFGGTDVEGDTFTKDTDFMLDVVPEPAVLYDHAQELKSVIGKVVEIKKHDAGLWMEAQVKRSAEYAEQILELVKQGRLGYSTGSVAHLVERLKGNIKRWAIYELSLTPTPAEPRTLGVEYLKALGIVMNAETDTDADLTKANELKGELPESAIADQSEAVEDKAITKEIKKENTMSDEVIKDAVEEAAEVPAEAPAIDVEAIKAELNNSVQDAVKNALDVEVQERGGILTESPAVKKITKMGGDHDGGDSFMHWIKTGSDNSYTKAALQEGTAAEGGVLVPEGLHESIIAKRDDLSVARAAGAMVVQTSVDAVQIPSENATGGFALTAEEGSANQSEPTFTSNSVSVYKFTNLTKVSDELLADEKAGLESFLGDMWARSAADIENDMFLTGSGSGQPQGAIAGGTAALTLDSGTTIAASEVPELYFKLPGAYAQEGDSVAWAMNHATLGVIRGLTGDNFMFVPTPQGSGARGPGQMLYGAPAYTSSHILSMAAGRDVVIIGNWKYYGIVERNEIVISRNPYLYQANGQVGFFVNIRFGGAVLQSEAFQYATNAG